MKRLGLIIILLLLTGCANSNVEEEMIENNVLDEYNIGSTQKEIEDNFILRGLLYEFGEYKTDYSNIEGVYVENYAQFYDKSFSLGCTFPYEVDIEGQTYLLNYNKMTSYKYQCFDVDMAYARQVMALIIERYGEAEYQSFDDGESDSYFATWDIEAYEINYVYRAPDNHESSVEINFSHDKDLLMQLD